MPTNLDATALCRLLVLMNRHHGSALFLDFKDDQDNPGWRCSVFLTDVRFQRIYCGATPDAALAAAARDCAGQFPPESR